MKNLYIRSQTLAMIKVNDIEMTSSDLTASAAMLSDMLSDPDQLVNQAYAENYEANVVDAYELSQCESTFCYPIDGVQFRFNFQNNVFMDNVPRSEWNKEEREFFQKHRDLLYRSCDFNCEVAGKEVIPFYLPKAIDAQVSVRYKDDIDDKMFDKVAWYFSPESSTS